MGAFGIGINNNPPDAGGVRGETIEIACQSWSTVNGKTIPLMIKIQDEDGELHTIRQIAVNSQERKNYAGVECVEYDCEITLLGKQFPAKLIHYLVEGRWVMSYR